ncbi:MAG: T9SS type A sorting domain-containing protein [bacterium]|nr:T9SS type A sorting domain-containing protein [bacterium]
MFSLIFLQITFLFSTAAFAPEEPIFSAPPPSPPSFSQSIPLHPKWNLVSWQLDFTDLFGLQIRFDEILPGPPTWLTNAGGQVYTWESRNDWYPLTLNSELWQWKPEYAYFLSFASNPTDPTELPWHFNDRPLQNLTSFPIDPSSAWDDNHFDPQNFASEWFFMGYAAPGYSKLASIPNVPYTGNSGDPANYDYEGPFHWLIWKGEVSNYEPYELKIIKDDAGRAYIPDPHPLIGLPAIDQIGTLEPGKGYFLGFTGTGPYNFEGWQNWDQWRNDNYVPPDPKENQPSICSGSHFQFNQYTHWSYPIVIDTIDFNQTPMAAGDEIGVFDGNRCVGAAAFSGEFPLVLTTWQDDIATPMEVDGYTYGNPMIFKWFDVSENTEAEFEIPPSIQAADDRVAPSHSGFGCGFYAQRSLAYGVTNLLQLPQEFKLGQNYPNPFNSATVIPLELPQRSKVRIEVFNVKGQRVGNLYESVENAGYPKVYYNAAQLSSGVYFCRVTAEGLERTGKFSGVSKLVLLK